MYIHLSATYVAFVLTKRGLINIHIYIKMEFYLSIYLSTYVLYIFVSFFVNYITYLQHLHGVRALQKMCYIMLSLYQEVQ